MAQLVLDEEAMALVVKRRSLIQPAGNRPTTTPAYSSKAMTVPICTLMEVVHERLSLLNSEEARQERNSWPPADQATYLNLGRRLKQDHMRGPVRMFRNKLGAHLAGTVLQVDRRLQPNG